MTRTAAFLIPTLAITLHAVGCGGPRTPARTVNAPTLADLSFLVGVWSSDQDGVTTTEAWRPAEESVMRGENQSVRDGAVVHSEVIRIEQRSDGIYYVASPQDQQTAEFRLTELSERRVVFENPAHDFPTRISYERSAGTLIAVAENDAERLRWEWSRQGEPEPAPTSE